MLSMIFLSDEERVQLRALHKRELDGKVRDRIKAILLFDKGWSITSIAEALQLSGIGRNNLYRAHTLHIEGIAKLTTKK